MNLGLFVISWKAIHAVEFFLVKLILIVGSVDDSTNVEARGRGPSSCVLGWIRVLLEGLKDVISR